MTYICMYPCLINMKVLNFEDFMKKHNLKDDTMNETELQKIYKYKIYPRDSKTYSDKGFVNIDNGSGGGTHWTCFIVKDNKSDFNQINFFLINYLNQKYIIIIKYKI